MAFELERPWALDPQVALRPERFGALAPGIIDGRAARDRVLRRAAHRAGEAVLEGRRRALELH